jgi:hypothetical protein
MTLPAMHTMFGALRADSDDEKGIGRSIVAREGKACAGLIGRDVACAGNATNFGCVAGGSDANNNFRPL